MHGRFQEAVAPARRVIELAGASSPLHIYASWNLANAGQRDEAMGVLKQVGSDLDGTVNGTWALFYMHALAGKADEALTHVTPELEQAASFVEFFALVMGDAYALIGRNDDAVRWIRIAVSRGFINYPFLSRHENRRRSDALTGAYGG